MGDHFRNSRFDIRNVLTTSIHNPLDLQRFWIFLLLMLRRSHNVVSLWLWACVYVHETHANLYIYFQQGAKLFNLSGVVDNEYQQTEVHNLCRFISVITLRPLTWRSTHPHVLADR